VTERELALLKDVVAWMRKAAEHATASRHPDEALGLLRGAAKLEHELPRGE
jgi:hypothetical protein